jgi:hypothetical protein
MSPVNSDLLTFSNISVYCKNYQDVHSRREDPSLDFLSRKILRKKTMLRARRLIVMCGGVHEYQALRLCQVLNRVNSVERGSQAIE